MTVPIMTIRDASDDPRLLALKNRVQEELEALRASFLVRRPFLAQMALQLDLIAIIDDRIATAATNGRVIYFDARYFDVSSPAKREFVFAHEVWHCALGHMSRAKGRDQHLWNLATDHEVNVLLAQDGFEPPDGAVRFSWLTGMSAEEVYDHLLGEPQTDPVRQKFDVHLPCVFDSDPSGTSIIIDRQVDLAGEAPSVAEATALSISVARRVARTHGYLPGAIAAQLHAWTKPKVDWRVVFAQFLERALDRQYSWSRPQRRLLHSGLYLPSRNDHDGVRHAVVGIDVSGSVLALASAFLSEVRGMLQQVDIHELELLFFDTRICHRARVSQTTSLDKVLTPVKAGGGTCFIPVFDEVSNMKDKPSLFILLTDGYGSAPASPPEVPILWALIEGGSTPVTWGSRVTLTGLS